VDSGDTVDKYRRSDRSYVSGDRSSQSRANSVRGIVFCAGRGIIIYARSLRNSDGPQPQGEGSFEGHSGLALLCADDANAECGHPDGLDCGVTTHAHAPLAHLDITDCDVKTRTRTSTPESTAASTMRSTSARTSASR